MLGEFAKGGQLAQARPSVINTLTAIVTNGGADAPRVEITSIHVANTTGSAATFRLCHDNDGTTYDQSTALYWDVSVPANSTFLWQAQHPSGGLQLGRAGNLAFSTGTIDALTCTVYGVTEAVQERTVVGDI